jgi:predicted TPR repeat methyltransferase
LNINPWLEIPLKDYEAHMSSASVGQAQYLAATLSKLVQVHRFRSVAVLGCSGGNGFDQLPPDLVERVVGVDINPEFVEAARERYNDRFDHLELLCDDILSPTCTFPPVDFVFAGLLFEYVAYASGLSAIKRFVKPSGHLSVVLQLPCETVEAVSPSPYQSLRKLRSVMKFVSPEDFRSGATAAGFTVQAANETMLASGKIFCEFFFQDSRESGLRAQLHS